MMMKTSLRQVGGSVAMVIPPAILRQLHLQAGVEMQINASEKGIFAEPVKQKPKYTLAELLAQSDFDNARQAEAEDWVNSPTVGDELL